MINEIKVTESSGNVFADIAIAEPEGALLKAEIAARICEIITARGLTQVQAANLLGLDQPKVSALLRGRLKGYSSDRLFRFLNALDRDVEILIKPKRRSAPHARVRVIVASRSQAPTEEASDGPPAR